MLKDELFPQSIIDLVSNYDKLLAASQNTQPTFRITSIHSKEALVGSESTTQPITTTNKKVETNTLLKMENKDSIPTHILNMSTTDTSVKDIATSPNRTEIGVNSNLTDIKKKIQNLSDELKKF